MVAHDYTFQCSLFKSRHDNEPRFRAAPWPEVVTGLTKHKERAEKDGSLWSPAIYANGSSRGNPGVEFLTAGVGDFDDGVTYESVQARLSTYDYIAHSTYSHTTEHPKFRIIIPFTCPVPKADWLKIKARIDEHVFGLANDPAAKDPSRMYYSPSCPVGADRFAEHHEGEWLDPYSLPESSRPVTPQAIAETGPQKVPLGKTALDFVANGAPLGEQRIRALAAARNYLSAGYSVEDTAAALWRGLQASPQDADRGPWTYEDAAFIAGNIDKAEAPPLGLVDAPVPPRCEIRRTLMGYVCSFPALGVTITTDHINRRSDGLKAEIDIECFAPGVPRSLHWGNFNLSSMAARNSMSSYLAKRAEGSSLGDDKLWKSILEDYCRKVAFAEREGEPPMRIGNLPEDGTPTWMVNNIILNREIGTIYGPGTTGKSRFALAIGLSVLTGIEFIPGFVPIEQGDVYYLDWETDKIHLNKRIKQLCRGKDTPVVQPLYLRCKYPMVEIIDKVMKDIEKHSIKLLIVDSVEAATTGTRDSGADQNAAVMQLYEALRRLGVSVLLIDHVNSTQARETKGVRKPYGSIFKYNYARYAFELRQSQEDKSPGDEHLALYCTKYNDGIRPKDVGLRVRFDDHQTVYEREQIAATELIDGLTQVEQIKRALSFGPMTTRELAEWTRIDENTIRAVTSKNKERFVKLGEGKGMKWGNAAPF